MLYRIQEVATMAGVSVRTLHHYDSLGLLKPETLTEAGYRLYSEQNLDRLQQILFLKELDFGLKEIQEMLDRPDYDRQWALQAHRRVLYDKRNRLDGLIQAVDALLEGKEMTGENKFKAFDMSEIEEHKAQYAEEAREKYGHTDAYKESAHRTASYTKEDWERITTQQSSIYQRLAALMDRDPASQEVQAVVEEARQLISDSYYDCTVDIFRGLGQMYVVDERFTKNIDKFGQGLAAFLSKGIEIYCDKHA